MTPTGRLGCSSVSGTRYNGNEAGGTPAIFNGAVYGVNWSSRQWSSAASPDSLNHSTGCGSRASVGVSQASKSFMLVSTSRHADSKYPIARESSIPEVLRPRSRQYRVLRRKDSSASWGSSTDATPVDHTELNWGSNSGGNGLSTSTTSWPSYSSKYEACSHAATDSAEASIPSKYGRDQRAMRMRLCSRAAH